MVILDHGLGLFTLYGHMSEIGVKVGQEVKPREPLGRSGETGLAGGDHLHVGFLVRGVYVSPLEWWDPHWLRDRVAKPLADAGVTLPGSPMGLWRRRASRPGPCRRAAPRPDPGTADRPGPGAQKGRAARASRRTAATMPAVATTRAMAMRARSGQLDRPP